MQQQDAFNNPYKYQPIVRHGLPERQLPINQQYSNPPPGPEYNATGSEVYGDPVTQTFSSNLSRPPNQNNLAPYQSMNEGLQAYYQSDNHQSEQQAFGHPFETNQSKFHNVEGVTFHQVTQPHQPYYVPSASSDSIARQLAETKPRAPLVQYSHQRQQLQQQQQQQQYCMPMSIAPRQRHPHYYVDQSGYLDHSAFSGFARNFSHSRQMSDAYVHYERQNQVPSQQANVPDLDETHRLATATNQQGVQYGHEETHRDCNSLSTYNSDVFLINDNNAAQIYQPMQSTVNSGDIIASTAMQTSHEAQANPYQFSDLRSNQNQTSLHPPPPPQPSLANCALDPLQQQMSSAYAGLGDENVPSNTNFEGKDDVKEGLYENCNMDQASDAFLSRQAAHGLRHLPRPNQVANDSASGRTNFTPMIMKNSSNSSTMNSTPSPINNRSGPHKQAARNQQDYVDMRSSGNLSQEWLDTICRHMIEHMNSFGICVIDNFLGSIKGEMILKEVKQLFTNRSYTTGKLVSDKLEKTSGDGQSRENEPVIKQSNVEPAKTIRNDRVIWVDGCEDGCEEINNLIQTLCSVITNSSRLSLYSNNGLDKVVISKRTKAHVACYPGNGSRYIKHVDNPNGDGRVITAIYYLNKSWNTKKDGGLLRMFPTGVDTVANIEPLFDRVLFFWSDRRNPHEVLPAHRDRFAITVWYIGESRTQEALS